MLRNNVFDDPVIVLLVVGGREMRGTRQSEICDV